jgi:hypothetical protein
MVEEQQKIVADVWLDVFQKWPRILHLAGSLCASSFFFLAITYQMSKP